VWCSVIIYGSDLLGTTVLHSKQSALLTVGMEAIISRSIFRQIHTEEQWWADSP